MKEFQQSIKKADITTRTTVDPPSLPLGSISQRCRVGLPV